VIDSNLSTITAEADKVVRVGGAEPLIVHTEFLTGRDLGYPDQAHWYNTLLRRRHRAPVWSVVVLLRPAADGPELTGTYEESVPGLGPNLWFRYDVIRVWLQPPERLLTAGLRVLPLAPVANVAAEQIPGVLLAMSDRMARETSREQAATLWTATSLLMGLRYEEVQVDAIIEGVSAMLFGIEGLEESSVYQGILRRGRAEGRVQDARQVLLRHGRKKFGPPDERVETAIATTADLGRLHDLIDRVLDVSSWGELLAAEDSPGEEQP
jgi:hypothetical protein